MNVSVTLPSGKKLDITLGAFAESKALYQAFLEESKSVRIEKTDELDVNMLKDLFCMGLSSKKIEAALEACLKRCAYNGHKITDATFEDVAAREDYLPICLEVARVNIEPFMKSLFAQYGAALEALKKALRDRESPSTMKTA